MKLKVVAALATIALIAGSGVAVAAIPLGPNGDGPGLAAVGPVSATDGFPTWYKDQNGLRLEHCIDPADLLCPSIADLPDPAAAVSFPGNYPEEAFYARVEAKIPVASERPLFPSDSLVEIQLEQAFGAGAPSDGDQVTFARVRYRFDAPIGQSYKVTSPVTGPEGKTVVSTGKDDEVWGEVFDTEDIGLGGGDFRGALGGRIGPFLTWDTFGTATDAPPAGYIGDGLTPHKIKGSPYNNNLFRIEGLNINLSPTVDACPTVDGPVADCVETDLFAVQGKIATTAGVTVDQATYGRSSATRGYVDVFASSEPDGPQAIEVTDVSPAPALPEFNPTGLKGSVASDGHYFAHVNYIGTEPPTRVQVSNIGDVPVSTKVANVVDRISGAAVYTTGIGDLAGSLKINALSSDMVAPRILTASGFGASLPLVAGALIVPLLDAPPLTVTVTSDAGGRVKLPVEIVDGEGVPIPAVANAGPDQIVAAGQVVTLDGSASTGTALTYAWSSAAGVGFSDPTIVNPAFTAPALPGIYPIDLTVTGPVGVSTATVTITVANAPDAPVIGIATAADTTATVAWTAPVNDGGSPLTGYDVQMVDSLGIQIGALLPAAETATSLDVTGLTNGTPVKFLVRASNAAATGAYSLPSAEVTPTGAPSAPALVTAIAGNTMATVTWTAPVNDGGSPITGYTVRAVDAADAEVALLPAAADATSLVVPGLVNGTAVRFQVQATNAFGTSAFSALSAPVSIGFPDAPVIGTATPGDAMATATWAPPANDGGLAITGYTVQVADAVTGIPLPVGGLLPAAADATSLDVTGLVNGTPVTFQVQATNAAGTGLFSALSNAVTPTGAPDAPVIGIATAGNASVTVTWTAPVNDGGSAITRYDVQQVDAAGLPVGALLPAGVATSLLVTDLVNGTAVEFQVQATNAVGTSVFSASSAAVTPATVADAPTLVTATAGDATATVTWTAPVNTGGSAITGYTVRVANALTDAQVGALLPAAADVTSLVVTGLVNGTAVRFEVQATNAAGASIFSVPSAAVTPAGVPGMPTILTPIAGDTSATVTWAAPDNNGGSAITGYTVKVVNAAGTQVGLLLPAAAGATSLVVTGLVNGTAVRFQVQATNAVGTGAFSILSNAVTPAPTRMSDFNGDGFTDMVARDNAGQLWLYPGNGTGGFQARTLMATGWQAFTAIVTPGDVTGDGFGDVMAVNRAGALRLYSGNGRGGFLTSRVIGASGWDRMSQISAAGDLNGDKRPDILARDRDGTLWLYPTTTTGSFQTRRVLGASGWNTMTAIRGAGDLSGDGKADVLARDGAGVLWLYPGNGTGGLGARTVAGASGWQVMTALVTPGNWNGTVGNDLLARDGAGSLWLYPGNNAGTFGTRVQIGTGFNGYTIA